MTIIVDPGVSLLISNIRSTKIQARYKLLTLEFKKLLAKDSTNNQTEHVLWKKLFFIYKGFEIRPLDFIKACVSKDLRVKRLGYQGLPMLKCENEIILLCNTISNDLKHKPTISDALIFLSKINIIDTNVLTVLESISIPESDLLSRKLIITKARHSDNYNFNFTSQDDQCLFVKLQILIDSGSIDLFKSLHFDYLKDNFKYMKCPFTKLKTVQVLYYFVEEKGYALPDEIVYILKEILDNSVLRMKSQMELALAVEISKLLIICNKASEKVEEFVFKLILSNNQSIQVLGYNIIVKYKIIPEIAINHILELENIGVFHMMILSNLINKFNYKIIYQKIAICGGYNSLEQSTLLLKIAKYADQELLKCLLIDFPEIYHYIALKNMLSNDCLNDVYSRCNINDQKYFVLIYNLIRLLNIDVDIHDMISRHFDVLSMSSDVGSYNIFDHLVDFLCTYGDVMTNRDFLKVKILEQFGRCNKEFFDHAMQRLMKFNFVLSEKFMFLKDTCILKYYKSNNRVIFKHDGKSIKLSIIGDISKNLQPSSEKNELQLILSNNNIFVIKINYQSDEIYKVINPNKL